MILIGIYIPMIYDLSFLKAYDLWTHRDVIQNMTPSQVATFLNNHRLDETISDYISAPWLHNAYLDWVILDAISFRKLVALRQEYLITRYGVIAYFLANGVVWGMWALRLLVWLAKWGLPVVICYFIAEKSTFAAIITAGFWYGLYISWLFVKLWDKIFILITLKETLLQKLARLQSEGVEAYNWLAGPVLHIPSIRRAFDQATQKGIVWNQAIFYILDRLSDQQPQLWKNSPPESRG
jgi:hypothetical protein